MLVPYCRVVYNIQLASNNIQKYVVGGILQALHIYYGQDRRGLYMSLQEFADIDITVTGNDVGSNSSKLRPLIQGSLFAIRSVKMPTIRSSSLFVACDDIWKNTNGDKTIPSTRSPIIGIVVQQYAGSELNTQRKKRIPLLDSLWATQCKRLVQIISFLWYAR